MPKPLPARIEAAEGAVTARAQPVVADILVGAFPEQRAFVEDAASLGAVFCTRRAAKSYSAALKAIRMARRIPRCSVLVLGLMRAEVKRIFWDPIFKDIDRRHHLGLKFNETELSIRLPNGSVIYLLGADANENEKRKLLGQKFALVIIDEAQDFVTDLNTLVFHVLKPAVADHRGAIWLLGTPGLIARGLFYDATTGREPGWRLHEWSAFDNPYIADNWRAEIEELKAMKPGVETTPWFRRNYLREWVIDDEALVYRYVAGRNDFTALPTYRLGKWHFVLGVDLGFKDPSAFVVCAYHDHDPTLYVLETYQKSGMDITDVANKVKWYGTRYDFDAQVIDGANLQAVEEMRNRHDLALVCADKTGKPDFIELMASEMTIGRVKAHPTNAKDVIAGWRSVIWDPKKLPRREEHEACDNHATDAGLYAWRYCYQYLSQPEKPPEAPEDEMERLAEDRYIEEHRSIGIETEGVGDSSNWEAWAR